MFKNKDLAEKAPVHPELQLFFDYFYFSSAEETDRQLRCTLDRAS
jgi:hypothetical protein